LGRHRWRVLDTNPYQNHVGTQAGYILAVPQVALFQDYNTSPTHDFNATFEVGKSYDLTVGVFGKPSLAPGSTLQISLYYLDGLDNKVTVAGTTVTYSAEAFPTTPTFNLVDFGVNVRKCRWAMLGPGGTWASNWNPPSPSNKPRLVTGILTTSA